MTDKSEVMQKVAQMVVEVQKRTGHMPKWLMVGSQVLELDRELTDEDVLAAFVLEGARGNARPKIEPRLSPAQLAEISLRAKHRKTGLRRLFPALKGSK